MADLRILLLVSLLSLPPGQGEGPCLDELYVEGCPSYLFQAIGLYLDTNRTVFIEPREISEIIIRSGGYQPVNITTRHQIRLWGNGCRFHRLIKVVFVPGENGLVTWRPEGQAFKLEAGIRAYGRVDYIEPGKRSYDIAIHGSSAGPSCGISCPSLNLNFMSAAYCGHPMVIISVNKTRDPTWSYFDFSALVSRHTASGPPEDVPTALASPSSISTVDGDKTNFRFSGSAPPLGKVYRFCDVSAWIPGRSQKKYILSVQLIGSEPLPNLHRDTPAE